MVIRTVPASTKQDGLSAASTYNLKWTILYFSYIVLTRCFLVSYRLCLRCKSVTSRDSAARL